MRAWLVHAFYVIQYIICLVDKVYENNIESFRYVGIYCFLKAIGRNLNTDVVPLHKQVFKLEKK